MLYQHDKLSSFSFICLFDLNGIIKVINNSKVPDCFILSFKKIIRCLEKAF